MSRRRPAVRREISPDPLYQSVMVSGFINVMMHKGKKAVSERIFYHAMERLKGKGEDSELALFRKAIENIKPLVETKSRRVGGATYQVPIEVRTVRQQSLAFRWILAAARKRSGHSMEEKLSAELLDAYNRSGGAYRKKEETYRMAEGNRAFAHYRW